ncbi:MAG: COX15/CtaA family protein [Chitinophagaceae bacterium]
MGWIMVASGLNPDDTHVSHIKLAMHFMFALVLLCYTLWFALKLRVRQEAVTYNTTLKGFAGTILVLFALQLCYGAFMAGLKAAPAAATWPDINGSFFPADIHQFGSASYSGIHIFTDHPLMVHFIHRSLAYLITALLLVFFFRIRSTGTTPEMRRAAGVSAGLVLLQVLLGVCTILNAPLMTQSKFQRFEWLAELHQMVAILLLISLVYNYFLLRKQR